MPAAISPQALIFITLIVWWSPNQFAGYPLQRRDFFGTEAGILRNGLRRHRIRQHFKDLLAKYPKVNVGHMGFPIGWETHPLWKNPK